MNRSTWLLIAMITWIVAIPAQLAVFYPQLPDEVATHFNGCGVADGWSSKSAFLTIHLVTAGSVSGLFALLWFLLPLTPASMINLPNKDYWLSLERRPYTNEVVREFLLWMGHLTCGFLMAMFYLTMKANLNPPPRMGGGIWIVMSVYLFFLFIILGRLLIRFRLPKSL